MGQGGGCRHPELGTGRTRTTTRAWGVQVSIIRRCGNGGVREVQRPGSPFHRGGVRSISRVRCRLQHALLTLQGLVRGQRTPPDEQQSHRRRMEASWLYALQGHRRSTVLEGAQNKVSGAQWHTYGAGLGPYATPQLAYIRRILRRVAKVAHPINKYIRNNKINIYQGTLGFSCATCATCYVLFPIGKPKSTVAHSASVRHSGVPLKRSVS